MTPPRTNHPAGDCPGGCDEIKTFDQRLADGSHRMDAIEASVSAIQGDVSEVLDIVRLGKTFFRLAAHLGAFLKWATAIGAPVLAFYLAWKSGKV